MEDSRESLLFEAKYTASIGEIARKRDESKDTKKLEMKLYKRFIQDVSEGKFFNLKQIIRVSIGINRIQQVLAILVMYQRYLFINAVYSVSDVA